MWCPCMLHCYYARRDVGLRNAPTQAFLNHIYLLNMGFETKSKKKKDPEHNYPDMFQRSTFKMISLWKLDSSKLNIKGTMF